MSQEVGPHRHWIYQGLDLGLLSLQNHEGNFLQLEAIQTMVTCYSISHRPRNQISDKSLGSKIYKEHKLNNKKTSQFKMGKRFVQTFFQRRERSHQAQEMLSITSHQRNASQNPNKVPLHKVLGAELCSFKKAIPPASEWDPIWRKGLYRGNETKTGHQGQSESNMIGVLIKRGNKEYTEGRCDVKTHRETIPWQGRD